MTYSEISEEVQALNYRDKLRLAQLLLQLARKEEEVQNPAKRAEPQSPSVIDPELLVYVSERLRKLRPAKREGVLNSIGAMFQFRGGISDSEKEAVLAGLVKNGHISIQKNNHVGYPE